MVFVQLRKATTSGKKYTAVFYDDDRKKIKTTHFGQAGANDFTSHGEDAEERKQLYLDRHKNNENWADYKSCWLLVVAWILWNRNQVYQHLIMII